MRFISWLRFRSYLNTKMIHLLIPFATCSNHVYCFTNYMMRITLVRIVTKLVRQVEVVRGKGITLIGQKVGETF